MQLHILEPYLMLVMFQLPDYYDVIEHPMDFGTISQKLVSKAYHSFEQFEDDVFLICTNAMQYNAPDTIYFRQARSMQDMGRKEFQKLKTEGKCIEIDSKCEEKIGFNSTEKKPLQNCLPMVVQEPLVSNISFATTRAFGEGACSGLSPTGASGVEPVNTSYGHAYGGSSLGECKSEKVVDLNGMGYSREETHGKMVFMAPTARSPLAGILLMSCK